LVPFALAKPYSQKIRSRHPGSANFFDAPARQCPAHHHLYASRCCRKNIGFVRGVWPRRWLGGFALRLSRSGMILGLRGVVVVLRERGGAILFASLGLSKKADIGVFGGSGFYSENPREVWIETPYGMPSDRVALGEIAGKSVAFLPRHGKDHRFPPQAINYRANAWAMKELGVTRIIGPTACGSLKAEVKPGDMVVADQIVDRTTGRKDTFLRRTDHDARQFCRSVLLAVAADRDRTFAQPRDRRRTIRARSW
jgi:hypothetical protein